MLTRHRYEEGPALRVDHFLVSSDLELSRSQIKRLIDDRMVTLGGKAVKTSTKLKPGDEVVVGQQPPVEARALAQDIPLTVLHEDEHLIVVDKVAGMVVHPAPGHADNTLVNALLGHCKDLSGIGGELRPGIVHRIDQDTSGILVASKDDHTHQALSDGFKNKRHRREYVAISSPGPKASKGTLDTFYGRHPVHRKKSSSKLERGKRAVTHFEVRKRFGEGAALLCLRLETGRTHQIRVHCADAGFALLGDAMYGRLPRAEPLRSLAKDLGRQALHAAHLAFVHPLTGKELSFSSPLPDDMQRVLDALEH
ncbi:MAG: RluA family pseudouridine synthase [Myxococcales bacterium]|nr:RluA family pseudouridine synthase [Myxococcales bacterium]